MLVRCLEIFFFKQKTAYEVCGRDWSSDVCSSDLERGGEREAMDWYEYTYPVT